jgi:phosphoribosylanthranilate isomerase
MEPAVHPRLKVCCILDREEAGTAIRAGADALGLVSAMPSGPGVIDEATIAAIAQSVPPPVATFLLTSIQSVAGIVAQHRALRTSTIQIVDTILHGTHAELRAQLPGVKLVQVIHVTGPGSIEEAVRISAGVDAVLLDSGNPAAAVKELGGTGRRHDWSLSRAIREALDIPVFLAGGLHAGNAREAITEVGPFGLDVCSGVRTDGRLDGEKLRAFVAAMKGA